MSSNAKDVRRCCACHEHAPKTELLRFVRTPDGDITLDLSKKADGRGVWVHDSEACIGKLVKRKLLNAAFKTSVAQEVYDELGER